MFIEEFDEDQGLKNDFQLLPEELDEKVATWHLPSLGAGLTVFTQEHTDSIGAKIEDTFKGEHYRGISNHGEIKTLRRSSSCRGDFA